MENNRPHSREKRVGQGSVTARRGDQANTGGPVGGGSQNGRPGGGFNGQRQGFDPAGRRGRGYGVPRRAVRRSGGGISIFGILVILFFLFRSCGSDDIGSAPIQTPRPTAYSQSAYTAAPQQSGLQTIGGGNGLFSSDDVGDWSSLLGPLFGNGESYSGSNPNPASESPSESGGLLQDLPGVKPSAAPKPTATAKPTATPKPAVEPTETRARFFTPLGSGRDTVTVMVYLCGTDLESKYGMATSDLNEMAKANLSDKVNLIVETGGCRSWKNNVISNRANQIYRVRSGGVEPLENNFGSAAMTDPANLSKFIQYCAENYPANRNILILWDHGGGSISGYGYDEKTGGRSSMTLPQISTALQDGGVTFDWIGYDACLMSTLETALVSADYADYLIASEEVEPGTGWYYTGWLNALSRNTSVPTEQLGKTIIDDYVSACRQKSYNAQVTLAMTDLAALQSKIPAAFRDFSLSTYDLINSDGYRQVSNARAGARQFAESTRINQVDLVNLAERIGTEEGRALAQGIRDCVRYNGTTIPNCGGLSIYFPYESMSSVSSAINTYDSLGLDEEYAKVIKSFASLEYGGQVGSAASQGSYSGYSDYGSLLESLFGSYAYSGSSSYGGSPYGSVSPAGSLSHSYTNAYGQQSAGYSIGMDDIFGLLSAFAGRSLPADRAWVDTELIASHAGSLSESFLDPGRIAVSRDSKGRAVVSLSDEEWSLVQTVELNVFADDGQGYLDLGLDNVFTIEGNDLILDFDQTWLVLNDQLVAYYLVSDTQNPDGSWTTIGRIPALLNGELVNLQVVFDDDNPDGSITGAYPFYENGETETSPKGLVPLQAGDRLEFVCDAYRYDGGYEHSCKLDSALIVPENPEELALENVRLTNKLLPSYRFTDIYGNHYWISF